MYTSPSFCLVRHHYEAGEQNKHRLTFYSLYMHIACENTYSSPEAARVTVKGSGVSTYEPVAHLKLTRRLSGSNPVYAKTGAEVKLLQQTPRNLHNHRDEAHNYFLVHYVDEPNSPFYIAQSQLQHEYPKKPTWMSPPECKPARHGIPSNRDLTLEELKSVKPERGISDDRYYLDTFNKSFSDYSVTTCVGKAHFLAQVFHESDNLYYTKEIGRNAKSYSPWYGRGLIQITFRDNYQAYGDYVGEDFISSDVCREKLSVAPHAVKSAYWYIYVGRPVCQKAFEKNDLLHSSFLVNGGLTHYIDRQLKINLAIGSFANPSEFVKNINGEYEFESSEIYNVRK